MKPKKRSETDDEWGDDFDPYEDCEEEIARQIDEDAANIESITRSMDGYT
jgi:hypothetical protein